MPKERILGLVDAENLYYTPKQNWGAGAKVDFAKLYRKITGGCQGAKVIVYLVADPVIDQSRFIKRLIQIGYTPRVKILYSNRGRLRNSNWDDDIIEDGRAMMPDTDRLVLVSGDGDFSGLIHEYKAHGKQISVMCFEDDFSPQLKVADSISFLDKTILMGRPAITPRRLSECRFPMQHSIFRIASQ